MIGKKEMGTGFIIESLDGVSQDLEEGMKYVPAAEDTKCMPVKAQAPVNTKKFMGASQPWKPMGRK